MVNLEKVNRVVYLQLMMNSQISTSGEADISLVDDLENLIDTLTDEEQDKVLKVFQILETK